MSDASDRSLPATPKRRDQARRQGMLASAALPAWAASLAAALALLPGWWRATLPAAAEFLRQAFAPVSLHPANPVSLPSLSGVVWPTVALATVAMGVGLVGRLLLDRPVWSPARVLPAWLVWPGLLRGTPLFRSASMLWRWSLCWRPPSGLPGR